LAAALDGNAVVSDRLPLFAASFLEHEYMYGFCFFRQRYDPSLPRGFFQVRGAALRCDEWRTRVLYRYFTALARCGDSCLVVAVTH
jgi:hypothetical protein